MNNLTLIKSVHQSKVWRQITFKENLCDAENQMQNMTTEYVGIYIN